MNFDVVFARYGFWVSSYRGEQSEHVVFVVNNTLYRYVKRSRGSTINKLNSNNGWCENIILQVSKERIQRSSTTDAVSYTYRYRTVRDYCTNRYY